VHRFDDGARNAIGRLGGFEIGLESIEFGLQRHGRLSFGFRVGLWIELTRKNLKETAMEGSEAVGLDFIPLGNNDFNSRGR
jgi:hypothetical protein